VRVHLEGVDRTREDILVQQVKPIFSVEHFEELVLKSQDVRNALKDLGCFSEVDVHIDTSEKGDRHSYEVTFKVSEVGRISGSVNTMVGHQEGSLFTGLKLPNLLGGGEKAQVDYQYGTRKTAAFNASLEKPLHGRAKTNVGLNAFQQHAEFPQSGFKELNRGLLFDLSFASAPQLRHRLQLESSWRQIHALNRGCAFDVRSEAGHNLKNCLRFISTVDRRDDQVFPTEGSLLRLTEEWAGFGGDIGYFKTHLETQLNLSVPKTEWTLQGCFNAGLLRQIDEDKKIAIADRFFLGGPAGPASLRGFEMRSVGKQSENCFMGANAFWSFGLHLFAPLPFRPSSNGNSFSDLFRTHAFLNAGNLGDWDVMELEDKLRGFRLSYGLGVAFKLGGIARIELNYCVPVRSHRGDKAAPGLQFGIGVNFV